MSSFKSKSYSLIDHVNIINEIYCNVKYIDKLESYNLMLKLFSIILEERNIHRKRSYSYEDFNQEISEIKDLYNKFLKDIPNDIKAKLSSKYKSLSTAEVRALSQHLTESVKFDHLGINGGNNSNVSLKCKIKDEYFLIPPHSRFYCGCVKNVCVKLDGNKFDILVADPPWWNKYIRRLKNANDKLSYSMMYNEDIASIPVKNLLSDNCLVAVWCTNSPSNIDAVKNIIFPNWGVKYIATWYWLKVTVDLEPICAFGTGSKKQPYERLIFGKVGDVKEVPDGHLIVSIPSALHSHKPPLLELLSKYIDKENPQTLELFARYLLPNTTSVGFEPLKWQHISLYEKVT